MTEGSLDSQPGLPLPVRARRAAPDLPDRNELYIDGGWLAPAERGIRPVVSPYTERRIASAADAGVSDIDLAVRAASTAFQRGEWRHAPVEERLAVLEQLLTLLTESRAEIAHTLTAEMGGPIWFSQGPGTGDALASLAATIDIGRSIDWERPVTGASGPVLIRREAVGVVGAITPWNVPQFIIMNKLAPALLTGCSVVLKPAPETPLDALLLAELLDKAGVPRGVVNVVPAERDASEALVRHPLVDKISFTGSTAAGRRIAALCGESLTRVSLELGGKSAAVVLDDADLTQVADALRVASFGLTGQICLAQTRILASRANYAKVVDVVAAMADSLVIGDPEDEGTDIGPLVARRQQERVDEYVRLGIREGARLVTGGEGRPVGFDRGWFARPTVFADVSNDMRIAREEIFGPVVVVIPYDNDTDAVRIANDSDYGLSGTVWTQDQARGLDVARRVRTGSFGVNRFGLDVRAPFGGYKNSGIGRELGEAGIASFAEYKSVLL